jgi:hypothetical protein
MLLLRQRDARNLPILLLAKQRGLRPSTRGVPVVSQFEIEAR